MEFYDVLDQVLELLRSRGRLAYRALKRQFDLDDEDIEALKDEIIDAQQLAIDENGKILVWTGEAATTPEPSSPTPTTPPVTDHTPPPISYTPQHLTEKILTSRTAWKASANRSRSSLPTSKTRPS